MKNILHYLFIVVLLLSFQGASSQSLYQNIFGIGNFFNPRIGSAGTPVIVFDDVDIPNSRITTNDSMSITKVKIGIIRGIASAAFTVKVYATPLDPLFYGYDSMPAVPPVLIGTVDFPANAGNARRDVINLGDSVTSLFNFKADTSNVYPGFTTMFIGLSFSVPTGAGWELSEGPDGNDDVIFIYDKDDATDPRYGTYFLPPAGGGEPPLAAFQMQVFGKAASKPNPVTLTNFDVQHSNNTNILTWNTSQEANSNYYSIERSADGNNFEAIGQVAAAGNSANTRSYTYTDANPVSGINYYRLKMVDIDGSVKYSEIKSVRNTEGNVSFRVYPNPAVETVYLEISSNKVERAKLSVTNIAGQVVYTEERNITIGKNIVPVKVANLTTGNYIIKVQLGDKNFIKKFTKQ